MTTPTFTTIKSGPKNLATFKFCNVGASISSYLLHATSPSSESIDLVCGFEKPERYLDKGNPWFGTTVGRVANRISNATLTLPHGSHRLVASEGPHTLHGSWQSYHHRLFAGPVITHNDDIETVQFELMDHHVEKDGFPGTVKVVVRYHVSEVDGGRVRLEVEYEAVLMEDGTGVQETAINLTNHSYFKVSNDASIAGSEILLSSNKILEVDDALIPTGKVVEYPVIPMDKGQVQSLKLGKDTETGGFADHCFVTRESCSSDTRKDEMKLFATLSNAQSGVTLQAYTTEPAFQFHTCDGCDTSSIAGEKPFGKRCGVCLEAQRYIDACAHEKWQGQVVVKVGQVWGSSTRYEAFRK